jgi:hypothetical protein
MSTDAVTPLRHRMIEAVWLRPKPSLHFVRVDP